MNHDNAFVYPDITVACPPCRFHDQHKDTLVNPVIIIEVLSDSSEAYDRGQKLAAYRRLDSAQEILLISQKQIFVEKYSRQNAFWTIIDNDHSEKMSPWI